MLILPDTSAWIGFFSRQQTPTGEKLARLIELDQDVCLCGPTLTESLQGVRHDEQLVKISRILGHFTFLEADREVFQQAAIIYRTCRAGGYTIRKTMDCIIAATALRHEARLLHNDRDFEAIARFFPLKFC
jgi:predicted nucleic acid-binding protein